IPFGEIVVGSPGSGKSTYAYGKHQLFTALSRPISIVNLDPANDSLPYPCAIDISSFITLKEVMDIHGLGPNGAMLYCIEYLDENYDWLEERLRELGPEVYVVFDLPGQVELSTNHESLKRIIQKLTKSGFRLAAIHLCDSLDVTDASKYTSVLILLLRATLHLELPHINVLATIGVVTQYGDLGHYQQIMEHISDASLKQNSPDYCTAAQDLPYLDHALYSSLPRFAGLNKAI
ncbi:hypothetical protein BD410DRAFT_723614, partial [Rickenella mellea]